MFQNVNILLRTLVLAGLVLLAGWWTLFLRSRLADHRAELAERREEVQLLSERVAERDRRIGELDRDLAASEREIDELELAVAERDERIRALDVALQLLKVDHRLARIRVLDQTTGADDVVRTRLRFSELDAQGEPIGEGREVVVLGKTVYVETLVVKFEDSYVEEGDALRGTSICLFRRLFGEQQRPSEGEPLDPAGLQPLAYAEDEGPNPLHRELWERFWEYANDPEEAGRLGVRATHGEAPFIETRPGKSYVVELRASGGLTIRAE